jgi:hypothetical protein
MTPIELGRVNLIRSDQSNANAPAENREEYSLSYIIWHHFNAHILPSDEHWWLYKYAEDLAPNMLEAGGLLFGYGVPWLEQHDLNPE